MAGRWLYIALVFHLSAIVMIGFWPSFTRTTGGPGTWHPVIYAHAAIFFGWLVLLFMQVFLIFRRRLRDHRRIGRFGIAYAIVLLLLGVAVTLVAPVLHVRAGEWPLDQAAGFLILPIGDLILFAGLFGAAIAWRNVPDVHKRYMVLAATALVFPGAARAFMPDYVLTLAIWLSPVFLAMAFDLMTMRRIHHVYWIGVAVLVAAFGRVTFMEWEPWVAVGRAVLRPFV